MREDESRAVPAPAHHIAKRLRAKLKQVKDELKRRRHLPVPEQGQWLASVVRGHLAYYAVPGNTDAIAFRTRSAATGFGRSGAAASVTG